MLEVDEMQKRMKRDVVRAKAVGMKNKLLSESETRRRESEYSKKNERAIAGELNFRWVD